jgi:hypothetical protein
MKAFDYAQNDTHRAAALLAASSALRFTGEDALRVIAWNSQTGVVLSVAYRFQNTEGEIVAGKFDLIPTTDRVLSAAHLHLGEGWLLGAMVYASAGAPRRGQCYAGLEVSRGQTGAREPLGTLTKDYVTEGQGIAWPGSPVRASV